LEVLLATLISLIDRVRLELGDTAKTFAWTTTGISTVTRYQIPYSPVLASSVVVYVNGVAADGDDYEVEETTGVLIFSANAPDDADTILVTGSHFRFFTDAELTTIVEASLNEHLYLKIDAFGRQLNMSNLPTVEEYPVAIWATYKALMTLATDAAFDIDIHTPDGVSIPRSERYGQLYNMAMARKVQYDDLCKALNIGIAKIEVFTYRRISKATNRYVPIYIPQEVDDRSQPQRAYLPIPTYGAAPVPAESSIYDITFTQGDDWSVDIDFPFDITGYTLNAQARLYPESAAVVANFTVTVTSLVNGTCTLSLTSAQTTRFPLKCYWDLQVIDAGGESFTYLAGTVFAKRQITRDVP
jgi:hypothetical protein